MRTQRLALLGAAGLVAAGLVFAFGLLPGDRPTATVEHCYVTYDRLERQLSWCTGSWTRAGITTHGPLRGVPVGTDWQVITAEPNPDYEWEVTVPDRERHPVGVAIGRTAFTSGSPVPWASAICGLLAIAAAAAGIRRLANG
jgi:hypothetical protein